MTLLGLQDGADHVEGIGYHDLVGFIMQHSPEAKEDLEQLWRRMAFNILVSNTDDHLRNHGFILTPLGWRLSPAFDMNPNEMGNGLTLNISENSNELDITLSIETAQLYQLKSQNAGRILKEMRHEISNWRIVAKKFGISNSEIEQTKRAFRLVDNE
jgi:serine/threonine-protein kinase HipA